MAGRPQQKRPRQAVHGVLVLDKPVGWSSNQVLQKVKWLLCAKKAGHCGTLDPAASGVLVLAFGAATKFSHLQLDADKHYRAQLQLGIRTDSGDREGHVIERCTMAAPDQARLAGVVARFTGVIEQVPPMHSALKKDGKPLYEYARAGQEVERPARQVHIHALSLEFAASSKIGPVLQLDVRCSKGTYIRTLGEDIARALGGCGSLLSLERTASGGFDLAQSCTLDALQDMDENQRLASLLPVQTMLGTLPAVTLGSQQAGPMLCGMRQRGFWPDQEQVAIYGEDPHAFLGLGQVRAGELIPRRLLSPLEIQQMIDA